MCHKQSTDIEHTQKGYFKFVDLGFFKARHKILRFKQQVFKCLRLI